MRRLFFFIFLCVLALNCRASGTARLTPMDDEVLSLIGQRIAPLIRRCVLREVSERLPQWTGILSVEQRAGVQQGQYVNAESLASVFLHEEQLDDICFRVEDYAPEFEASLWSRPESFIGALTGGKLLSAYDSRKIRALVDAYNGHQECWFGLEKPCRVDESDPSRLDPVNKSGKKSSSDRQESKPSGFTEITLHDFEKSFVLLIESSSVEGHYDDSVRRYRTVVFRKNDLATVSSYDGLFMEIPDRQIFLVARNAWKVLQDVYRYEDIIGNLIIIYDARNIRELMYIPLPRDTLEIKVQETLPKETVRFHAAWQVIETPHRPCDDQCGSGFARHFEYRYSIDCRAGTGKCELTKHLLRSYRACQTIFAC